MNSFKPLIVTLLFIFFFLGCEKKDICLLFLESNRFDSSQNCMEIDVPLDWDKILVIGSHVDSEDLRNSTGLQYNFETTSDPYKTILFVKENKVVQEICGPCRGIIFSEKLSSVGIVSISKNRCLTKDISQNNVTYIDAID